MNSVLKLGWPKAVPALGVSTSHKHPSSNGRTLRATEHILSTTIKDASPANKVQSPPSRSTSPVKPGSAIAKFYTASHAKLALPACLPTPKAKHNRAISHSFGHTAASSDVPAPAFDPFDVPRETMPLGIILKQDWSETLRVLVLSNRRADVCFALGQTGLPRLEELSLDGCSLEDEVRCVEGETRAGTVTRRPIFEVFVEIFPMLVNLDLSFNQLTRVGGLEGLFFAPPGDDAIAASRGLRVLRLKGNKITDLDGLIAIGERFQRGGASKYGVEGWKGEIIDVSDNEVTKARMRFLPFGVSRVARIDRSSVARYSRTTASRGIPR